ncbi:AzlD domain-containing protein [Ideonella sp. DXS29W]|uniref:AzlD domain-containing protein n=1 Tax=Ideonella lacteola TaxID=2984193 RepID=A0ABU9BQZ5_9BURK
MSTWEAVVSILGLGLITVLTRSFFLLPQREVPIPVWLREALRYAPLAALVAVIAPEVIMTNGNLIQTWQDARLYAAAAGALWYWWRRGILGTIVCGTTVLLALRFGLGW